MLSQVTSALHTVALSVCTSKSLVLLPPHQVDPQTAFENHRGSLTLFAAIGLHPIVQTQVRQPAFRFTSNVQA